MAQLLGQERVQRPAHIVRFVVGEDANRAPNHRATSLTVLTTGTPAGCHWLFSHPKVRLSPHISWSSPEGGRRIFELFLENLDRYVRGDALEGVVDKDERY